MPCYTKDRIEGGYMINNFDKYKNFILLTIGSILVVLSLCMLLYDKFLFLKSNIVDEIIYSKRISGLILSKDGCVLLPLQRIPNYLSFNNNNAFCSQS